MNLGIVHIRELVDMGIDTVIITLFLMFRKVIRHVDVKI